MKYSRPEIERRWLVAKDCPRTKASVQIEDRYILGTHLRLRKITSPEGPIYKLCKKYPAEPYEQITNLYLDETEYAHLKAYLISKTRHRLPEGSIDVYEDGTVIFEREFESEKDALNYSPPRFAAREITRDPNYTGFAIAKRLKSKRAGPYLPPTCNRSRNS